jgi:hypothetical protein
MERRSLSRPLSATPAGRQGRRGGKEGHFIKLFSDAALIGLVKRMRVEIRKGENQGKITRNSPSS